MNVYLIFPHGSTLALGEKQKEKIHVGYYYDISFWENCFTFSFKTEKNLVSCT